MARHASYDEPIKILGNPSKERLLAMLDEAVRAVRAKPQSAIRHCNRAGLLLLLGRREDALKAADEAIGAEPNSADAHTVRGIVLRSFGRVEEALRCSERAIKLDPGREDARNNRGSSLMALGRFEEAVEELDRAIKLEPRQSMPHANRGMALHRLGRVEEAIRSLRRAVSISHDDPTTWLDIGAMLFQLGKTNKSLGAVDTSIKLMPNNARAHHARGLVLHRLGRGEEARKSFERAHELDPTLEVPDLPPEMDDVYVAWNEAVDTRNRLESPTDYRHVLPHHIQSHVAGFLNAARRVLDYSERQYKSGIVEEYRKSDTRAMRYLKHVNTTKHERLPDVRITKTGRRRRVYPSPRTGRPVFTIDEGARLVRDGKSYGVETWPDDMFSGDIGKGFLYEVQKCHIMLEDGEVELVEFMDAVLAGVRGLLERHGYDVSLLDDPGPYYGAPRGGHGDGYPGTQGGGEGERPADVPDGGSGRAGDGGGDDREAGARAERAGGEQGAMGAAARPTGIIELEHSTLQLLAKIIGDAYNGIEITRLLVDSDHTTIGYGGGTKWQFLYDELVLLQDRRGYRGVLEFLRRVCGSPGRNDGADVQGDINACLAYYGLAIGNGGEIVDSSGAQERTPHGDGNGGKPAGSVGAEERTVKSNNTGHATGGQAQMDDDGAAFDRRGYHKLVIDHARAKFLKGEHFSAVTECCKAFEKLVQEKSGIDDTGADLMGRAFGPKGALAVSLPGLKDRTREDMRDGLMRLCQGIVAHVRNPVSHELERRFGMTREDALDILGTISYLCRQVERTGVRQETKDGQGKKGAGEPANGSAGARDVPGGGGAARAAVKRGQLVHLSASPKSVVQGDVVAVTAAGRSIGGWYVGVLSEEDRLKSSPVRLREYGVASEDGGVDTYEFTVNTLNYDPGEYMVRVSSDRDMDVGGMAIKKFVVHTYEDMIDAIGEMRERRAEITGIPRQRRPGGPRVTRWHMEATTSPEDYRRFDGARAIEFYTEPKRVPGHLVLSPTSDWDALSRASFEGAREPMDEVAARIEYPGPKRTGLPDIHLDFTYAGSAAIPLFDECLKTDGGSGGLTMRLWRFRITGRDGEVIECCFRAVLSSMSVGRATGLSTRRSGTLTVLDAQPFIEKA